MQQTRSSLPTSCDSPLALQEIPTTGPRLDNDLQQHLADLLQCGEPFALFALSAPRHSQSGWWLGTHLADSRSPEHNDVLTEPNAGDVYLFPFGWAANRHLVARNRSPLFDPEVAARSLHFTHVERIASPTARLAHLSSAQPESIPEVPPEYREAFARIQGWLTRGELYQLNLTRQFSVSLDLDQLWQVWNRGYQHFAPPCAAFVFDGKQVISCLSPEELLSREEDQIVTAPIKGTVLQNNAELLDEKNQAEHRMIVDLERNDLGQLCLPGSVRVQPLHRPVDFGGVTHLVSLVHGTLQPGVSFDKLVTELMPSGSVTGAPKLRVLTHIPEVEPVDRSYYCGAIGVALAQNRWQFSLPIRTLYGHDGQAAFGSGGGIVADSTVEQEWRELWRKTYWLGTPVHAARMV